ncbi:MAG: hypothetical protein ABJP70_03505 [Erythrobacter sp.]
MKLAKGPRPWSIWAFFCISLLLAVGRYFDGLGTLEFWEEEFARLFPAFIWNRDWTIVTLSAWFTVQLIPILLVFGFASRFARWLILAATLVPMIVLFTDIEYSSTYPRFFELAFIRWAIPILLVALLFLPGANRWFSRPNHEQDDAISS